MTRRGKLGLTLLLVVLAAAGLARWWWQRSVPPTGPNAAAVNVTGSPHTGPKQTGAAEASIELTGSDVVRARQAELTRVLTVNGSLKAVNSAVVKSKVAAELKSLTVREGQRVQAGQRIGQLDATEFILRLRQAEDQTAAAQAQLDVAQRTLDNNKALVNQGFISRTALDTSISNAQGAQASLQAARAGAEIARKAVRDCDIVAPISGLVAQRLAQPGERVGVDGRIVEIVDLARIELEAAIAPEDVVSLKLGQAAQVFIDGLPDPLPAKVARINPSAQSGSRTVLAYLELPTAPTLRQGLFARANVELQRKTALVVPASTLRLDQAQPYVLTLDNGLVRRSRVDTGLRGEAAFDGAPEAVVEITGGLQDGATVLRASVGALREGTRLVLKKGATPAAIPAAPPPPSPPPPTAAAASATLR